MPMTIAAGFLCTDGVLLCADTEHTGWTSKSHQSKVDQFDVPDGKVCFALAGASALAWSAMQKCKKQLRETSSTDLVADIEGILDAEYRRNVLGHPDYLSLDYSLLLALWTKSGGVQLFSTTATALTEVRQFQCLGVGAELASYLIRTGFLSPSLKQASSLAAYTLACVKESIAGCGGMSVYILLRKDGTSGVLTSEHDGPTKEIEKYARVYDFTMRRLLLWMADMQGEDVYFERNLSELVVKEIIGKRREWMQGYRAKEQGFADVNPHLTPAQVKDMFVDISMGFLPKPSVP
jgi:20S proteasome alpha/beta subunit